MDTWSARRILTRLPVLMLLLIALLPATGCSGESGSEDGTGSEQAAPEREAGEQSAEPEYTSWVVSIVDDQESSEGGMTYTIALNLQATNSSGYKFGTYTGTATARTTTTGAVGGGTLEAEAIAESTQLEFTLEDPEAGEPVASLSDDLTYTGSGTITMQAAGTASVGPASGGFANNSSQPFTMTATGETITMDITIDGKQFTFTGTISGRE